MWSLQYTNGSSDTYTITEDGSVTITGLGTQSKLIQSDNQKDFPSSEGWFKDNHVHRDATWEYIRLKDDGTLEVHHYCSDCSDLNTTFKGLGYYCCSGVGTKVPPAVTPPAGRL